jgi:hypothetical protein
MIPASRSAFTHIQALLQKLLILLPPNYGSGIVSHDLLYLRVSKRGRAAEGTDKSKSPEFWVVETEKPADPPFEHEANDPCHAHDQGWQ